MAFASFDSKKAAAPIADINMVPLIDVMLVLLVIFMVTAPLLTHSVKLQLPRASNLVDPPQPKKIDLAIDADGVRHWNGEVVSREEAQQRFAEEGRHRPEVELHLRVDQSVAYRLVAQTLADAARSGVTRVGFISEPEQP